MAEHVVLHLPGVGRDDVEAYARLGVWAQSRRGLRVWRRRGGRRFVVRVQYGRTFSPTLRGPLEETDDGVVLRARVSRWTTSYRSWVSLGAALLLGLAFVAVVLDSPDDVTGLLTCGLGAVAFLALAWVVRDVRDPDDLRELERRLAALAGFARRGTDPD